MDCHVLIATRSIFILFKHYTYSNTNYNERRLGNLIEEHELNVTFYDNFINKYTSHKKVKK